MAQEAHGISSHEHYTSGIALYRHEGLVGGEGP
jgi:hypothetical protein